MSVTSTPYDDVFRTLLNDCSSLIIPVINEIFCKHYAGKMKFFLKNCCFLFHFIFFLMKKILRHTIRILPNFLHLWQNLKI